MGYARAFPVHLSLYEKLDAMLGGISRPCLLVLMSVLAVYVFACVCKMQICVPLCL